MSLDKLTRPDGPFPLVRRTINGMDVDTYDREPRTLRDVFVSTQSFDERIALVYGDERWTFKQQRDIVVRLASQLHSRFGVRKGDRVAIAMRNYPEFAFAFWATQMLGAIATPLNAWLTSPELAELLDHCEPRVVFADEERLARLDAAWFARDAVVAVRAGDAKAPSFAEIVASADGPAPEPVLNDDDIATIVYTSGTTGRPKGVVGTHLNHVSSLLGRHIRVVAASGAGALDPNWTPPAKAKLMAYPLFHVAGVGTLTACAFSGHTLITMYKWDVPEAVRIIAREGVSELTGPPLVVQNLVEVAAQHPAQLSTLSLLGCGGALAPAKLVNDIHRIFEGRVTPTTGYGLTETTGGVIAISGAEFVARPDAIGRALPTVEIRLVDEADRDVASGDPGEILVRAPQVMGGYYRDAEASTHALAGGWFHTGDVARLDESGLYALVGRIKDIVIRGGENIPCAQVEACILEHADVIEAAALGVPHDTLGEELAAIVRVQPESRLAPEALRQFVGARLAAFKVPAYVELTTEPLPRTASGKLLKPSLKTRALAAAAQSLKER